MGRSPKFFSVKCRSNTVIKLLSMILFSNSIKRCTQQRRSSQQLPHWSSNRHIRCQWNSLKELSKWSWGLLAMEMNNIPFQTDSVFISPRSSFVILMITYDKLLQNSIENAQFSIIPCGILSFPSAIFSCHVNDYLWRILQNSTGNINFPMEFVLSLL